MIADFRRPKGGVYPIPGRIKADSKEQLKGLCSGWSLALSGKKELREQGTDRRAIPQGQNRRYRTLMLGYTGHFIVVVQFRIRSVTDIKCYDEFLLVMYLYKVEHDRQGGKYAMQKRGEYENGQ